ncbi:MAG: NUDIX hydrolase [Chloroflexi bacterium]|nr:MAG: NUDIX hydrolase [Chloroflexota bacterium]
MVRKWNKLQSALLGDYRIFKLRQDTSRSPRTNKTHDFYVLEACDWINVIPLTPEGMVVFIHQYRHGIEAVTLEIPGGMVDDTDLSPADSARRELLEETGYMAEEFVHIGTVAPNPAFLNNRCHSFLALGARKVQAAQLDGAEDIVVEERPLSEVPTLIKNGRITHALVIAAFHFLHLYQSQHPL